MRCCTVLHQHSEYSSNICCTEWCWCIPMVFRGCICIDSSNICAHTHVCNQWQVHPLLSAIAQHPTECQHPYMLPINYPPHCCSDLHCFNGQAYEVLQRIGSLTAADFHSTFSFFVSWSTCGMIAYLAVAQPALYSRWEVPLTVLWQGVVSVYNIVVIATLDIAYLDLTWLRLIHFLVSGLAGAPARWVGGVLRGRGWGRALAAG